MYNIKRQLHIDSWMFGCNIFKKNYLKKHKGRNMFPIVVRHHCKGIALVVNLPHKLNTCYSPQASDGHEYVCVHVTVLKPTQAKIQTAVKYCTVKY